MRGKVVFSVEGTVMEVLSHRRYRVDLANGHRLVGLLSARLADRGARLAIGERVTVEISPGDLSTGRIQVK